MKLSQALSITLTLTLVATGLELVCPSAHAGGRVDALIAIATDTSKPERDRTDAIFDLSRTGSSRAIPVLTRLLQTDTNQYVRSYSARGLGEFAGRQGTSGSVTALLSALSSDTSSNVRDGAADALTDFAREGNRTIVPALIRQLGDPAAKGHQETAFALGRIGNRAAVPALVAALGDTDRYARAYAARALGEFAGNHGQTDIRTPLLALLHSDTDSTARDGAADALIDLARAGDRKVVDALISELGDSTSPGRREAVMALGRIRSPKAIAALGTLVDSSSRDLRWATVYALGEFDDYPAAIGPLTRAASDTDSSIRGDAVYALSRSLPRHWSKLAQIDKISALNALVDRLGDSDGHTRSKAALLIAQLLQPYFRKKNRIARELASCFPHAQPRNPDDVRTGTLLFFDILFFGGVPVLTVADGVENAPRTPSVAPWGAAEGAKLKELLAEMVRQG